MSWFEILMIAFTATSALGIPILSIVMKLSESQRMHIIAKLDHLDECIDSLKQNYVGSVVTKTDLEHYRAEINETLSRMRIAISADTNGLHQRILRLEDPFFKRDS